MFFKECTNNQAEYNALKLALKLAKELGGEYLPILKSNAKREQKDSIGHARIKNAEFEIKMQVDLEGRHVVIVDDVVTSGASMASAAMLLKSLGAKSVRGLAFAVAYNDPFLPPVNQY